MLDLYQSCSLQSVKEEAEEFYVTSLWFVPNMLLHSFVLTSLLRIILIGDWQKGCSMGKYSCQALHGKITNTMYQLTCTCIIYIVI